MVKFIVKRLLWVIPVLLGASFLIFSLLHASPGDPAITSLGITATQEELDQFNEMHNLNDPLLVQYGKYTRVSINYVRDCMAKVLGRA